MMLQKSTIQKPRPIVILTIVLVAVGVIFRFLRLIEPRSFWLDECWLAYDLSTRTLGDIILGQKFFSPDFPVVPMGFAFVQKVFVLMLGQRELAYRIFPFFCSVFSIVLFARMAKEWFENHWVSLAALALFVSNEQFIHFSAEAKQYSTDVLVCLIILSFGPRILTLRREKKWTSYAFLAVTLSCSYLSIIMWGAVIIPSLLVLAFKKEGKTFSQVFVFSLSLLGMFALFHGSAIRQMMSNPAITHGAMRFFPEQPLFQPNNAFWALRVVNEMLQSSVEIVPSFLGFFLFLAGMTCAFSRQSRKTTIFALPIIMSFVMTIARIYPFSGRFIIQNTPIVFLFIGETFFQISRRSNRVIESCLAAVLSIWLLFNPFWSAVQQLSKNHEIEANRAAITILQNNMRSTDVLFVSAEAVSPFGYYASILRPFPTISQLIVFGETPELFAKGILCSGPMSLRKNRHGFLFISWADEKIECHRVHDSLPSRGKRTWLFLSHCEETFGDAWKKNICLGGTCRDTFTGPGVSLTLYESNAQ